MRINGRKKGQERTEYESRREGKRKKPKGEESAENKKSVNVGLSPRGEKEGGGGERILFHTTSQRL